MRCKPITATILFFCSSVAAAQPQSKIETSDADAYIQALDEYFKGIETRLSLLERGVKSESIRRKSKLGTKRRMRREIKILKSLLDSIAVPKLTITDFRPGKIGRLATPNGGISKVIQVFPGAILLEARTPQDHYKYQVVGGQVIRTVLPATWNKKLLWVEVDSTNEISGKIHKSFPGVFRVVSPKTYSTVGGGSNTVPQLRAVDMKRVRPLVIKWIAARKAKSSIDTKPARSTKKRTRSEQAAKDLLLAKRLLKTNKRAAKRRLKAIVSEFPNTPAAKTARELLQGR